MSNIHKFKVEPIEGHKAWIDNVNNAYANKKCNLTSCRYNADGKCTNDEKRKECIEVSEKVLCMKWEVGVSNSELEHPTQKPVELLKYLIETYTNENETVLDNCMGSGSTGVACVNTNRDFIGIELDKDYFNIAKQRITGNQKWLSLP